MITAKWMINTGEQHDLRYPNARFNEKGCLPVWGGDALKLLGAHTLDFIVHLTSSFLTRSQAMLENDGMSDVQQIACGRWIIPLRTS